MRSLCFFLLTVLAVSPIWPLGENPTVGDPFLIVSVSDKQISFIHESEVQSTYPIAIGKDGDETPIGLFQIIVKAKNPYYRKLNIEGGSPENPLGSRWIGFDANNTDGRIYGIHGTNRPDLIGKAVTAGCIRMANEHVEELFQQIPLGTKMLITDTTDLEVVELAKEYGAI
ncbi:L,D-transpeptidase [Halalkalibacter sp. APA_J-10(15)]|uniref:L,D-transpeptidase n=1 Tax=Halalkalibacter sp. APA_J-10(15) TaxID=2933805 RepID=UPI001FF58EF9|nr:L,D-transpeptidase [Halalkalibacter sp. APA_J-10(15)]MCK0471477.1 L,D-transpeptidase [Halalkalibacter sp. APA_J-10(15)]